MEWYEQLKKGLSQGVEVSKDLLEKARDKAVNLGERGLVAFDINQLETKARKVFEKIGSATYEHLVIEDHASVTKKTTALKELFEELEEINSKLKEKYEERKNLKKNEKTVDTN